jgi:uncharacterized membrane protein YidH (DUF202 family)
MKKFLAGSSLFLLPVLAFAQPAGTYTGTDLTTIGQVLNRLQSVINLIIPFIVGLAVLVIIYGIFGFITSAGDEEARANAKQFIIWGVIGVFLMVSVWGLVTILVNSFGTSDTAAKNAAKNTTIPVTEVKDSDVF